MDDQFINANYQNWLHQTVGNEETQCELKEMENQWEKIRDAFYQELTFGTGGLRGVIGAGTNRMNEFTVGKASQGLADYIVANYKDSDRKIAISYDSRIKSDIFAKVSAEVFAANGIQVYIYDTLMPTPCLSFAVRELGCAAGIMITASHNPAKYNGYKVYGEDGCQITTQMAAEIQNAIGKVDIFTGVERISFEDGVERETIQFIPENVYSNYIGHVKEQGMLENKDQLNKKMPIIYSPLNGTGLEPVMRVLQECGYSNIKVVAEQEMPDGNFTTCPYPNPEVKEALHLGLEYAKKYHAELLLATDPDCDRVGIAVKDADDKYKLLSGNETGVLLLDYVCAMKEKHGRMPADPLMIKTIVTTDMAERIAQHYGVETINVLTGFKFIGEQIGYLEKKGQLNRYVFGFEESYGYLCGTYVRDKDAVSASLLICEMVAYYKSKGITLLQKLDELYKIYGYCYNNLESYDFEGATGGGQNAGNHEQFA